MDTHTHIFKLTFFKKSDLWWNKHPHNGIPYQQCPGELAHRGDKALRAGKMLRKIQLC